MKNKFNNPTPTKRRVKKSLFYYFKNNYIIKY